MFTKSTKKRGGVNPLKKILTTLLVSWFLSLSASSLNAACSPKDVDMVGKYKIKNAIMTANTTPSEVATKAYVDTHIPKIYYATGNGPVDRTDVGQIVSRVLTVNKAKSDSVLKITYTDNMRALNDTGRDGTWRACRWEVKVNGNSCSHQPLVYDYISYLNQDNMLRSTTVTGYCQGVSEGNHEVQIWVGPTIEGRSSDCYTGWRNSTWVIEAREVYKK
jgi:hypothetical protein